MQFRHTRHADLPAGKSWRKRMSRPARALGVLLLTGVVALAGACTSSDKDKSGGSAGAAKERVTYLTASGAVGRDAFIWVAKQKGYFADAGIDLDIQKGAATTGNL